jgi:hypothetical protein
MRNENEILLKGLESLLTENEIKFVGNSYRNEQYQVIKNFLIENDYIETYCKFLGRDGEVIELHFRKKTEYELNNENLNYQIQQLETKFNVKFQIIK